MKKCNKEINKVDKCKIIGGIAFTVGMLIVIPKIIDKSSNYIFSKRNQIGAPLVDDWGPEIVKNSELERAIDEVI